MPRAPVAYPLSREPRPTQLSAATTASVRAGASAIRRIFALESVGPPRELEPSLPLLRALELCLTAANSLGVEATRRPTAELPLSVVLKVQRDFGRVIHDDVLTLLAVADPVASRVTGLTGETGAEPVGYDCEWHTISMSAGELSLYRHWDDEVPEFESDLIVRIGPGDEELDEPLVGYDTPLSALIEERIHAAIRFNRLPPLPIARAIALDPASRIVEG